MNELTLPFWILVGILAAFWLVAEFSDWFDDPDERRDRLEDDCDF